jgi:hypothetical protein
MNKPSLGSQISHTLAYLWNLHLNDDDGGYECDYDAKNGA